MNLETFTSNLGKFIGKSIVAKDQHGSIYAGKLKGFQHQVYSDGGFVIIVFKGMTPIRIVLEPGDEVEFSEFGF